MDNMWVVDPSAEMGTIRSFLGRFDFSGDEVLKLVRALSGGEKTKLCLAKLLYHPANLIILDEPTNHLDIYAREALEKALRQYDGSVLVVSHDRYFLSQVADKIVHLQGSTATLYGGDYKYFLQRQASVQPAVRKTTGPSADYLEFKEKSRQRSRLKKEIEKTRLRIGELETELAGLIRQLDENVPSDDWEQLQALTKKRDELEKEILYLYESLEKLEGRSDD